MCATFSLNLYTIAVIDPIYFVAVFVKKHPFAIGNALYFTFSFFTNQSIITNALYFCIRIIADAFSR
jgi:hypothetical protein